MAKRESTLKISDEDYNDISSSAYNLEKYHIGQTIKISNGQKLYVVDYKKTKKGLDALTLVNERDYTLSNNGKDKEKIQNAIIAYRGSEPIGSGQFQDTIKPYREEREQLIKELEKKGINIPKDEDGSFYDYAQGVPEYSNEILQDWLHMDTSYLVGKKPFDDGTENQAIQADQYAKKIHKDFKNADIQVTGHSLGGSNASYAVVINDFIKRGVTFENPNIYENLPEDVKARALKGDFRSRLTEYINLNDGLSLLNRDAAEIGNVKVMYDEALPNGVQNNRLPDAVKMLGLAFKRYNNQSLDVSLFVEALMGSHNLDRYNFNSDGSVQTVDDVLKNNPDFALTMLKQMKSTNVKANTGVSILIKSHVLMNTCTQLKHIAELEWSRIIREIERIDDKVKDSIEDVRNMHTRMVGFGAYDELAISDVDDLINKLKMNKPHHLFYSKEKYDQAVDAALHLQHLLQMVADDLGHMGHAYHDADRFMQRVTSQHSTTSLFSNAHLDTSEMTPEQLAAYKEKKRQEQKLALMNSIKKQLSYAFQEDRKNLSSIKDNITDAELAVKTKRDILDHHMSGKAIDSVTDKMKDHLSFDKVRSHVSSVVNSIGL